jgi:hypothetical protein
MALGWLENGNQTDTSAKDGFGWRCANQRCPKRRIYRTIRAGSFFERSHITLDKWLYVTYLWSQGTKVNSVERQVQIGISFVNSFHVVMAGLLDVSAKPKTHCSLLARRPLLYFDLWLKRLSSICTITSGVDSSLVEQTSLKY